MTDTPDEKQTTVASNNKYNNSNNRCDRMDELLSSPK